MSKIIGSDLETSNKAAATAAAYEAAYKAACERREYEFTHKVNDFAPKADFEAALEEAIKENWPEWSTRIRYLRRIIKTADADHKAFCKLLTEGVLYKQDWQNCRKDFLYDVLMFGYIFYFHDAECRRAEALLPRVEAIEIDLRTGVVSPTDKKLWEEMTYIKPISPCGGLDYCISL